MEVEISTLTRQLADQISERILRLIVLNGSFQQQTVQAARKTGKYRHGGMQKTKVTLLGGRTITLKTIYLRPDRRGRRGRIRGVGKRGSAGSGCYPVLAALGIDFGVTAAAVVKYVGRWQSAIRYARVGRRYRDEGAGPGT